MHDLSRHITCCLARLSPPSQHAQSLSLADVTSLSKLPQLLTVSPANANATTKILSLMHHPTPLPPTFPLTPFHLLWVPGSDGCRACSFLLSCAGNVNGEGPASRGCKSSALAQCVQAKAAAVLEAACSRLAVVRRLCYRFTRRPLCQDQAQVGLQL